MKTVWRDLAILSLIAIVSTFILWLPFILGLGQGMLTVFANYDGLNYIIVAKTLYNKTLISSSFYSSLIPPEYYSAHLPAYPLLIKLLSFFIPATRAMLLTTLLTTILATSAFYLFIKKFTLTTSPLWLSVVFLFLPARWLVVRGIGSPEPLFIFAILTSFYFFKDKKYWLAGLLGALAQITKTPGILLFVAYGLCLLGQAYRTKKIPWQAYPLLLIPLSIIPVFLLYAYQTGDFFAYLHSGDNFHLFFPPLQSLITGSRWQGDFWIEDMVWQYLIGALAVVQLIKLKHFDLAAFAGIFFTATLFIAHRDLARYSLPLLPFALIAFSPLLTRKEFKVVFLLILFPVYLYAVNFILHNTAPIAYWSPYL